MQFLKDGVWTVTFARDITVEHQDPRCYAFYFFSASAIWDYFLSLK